MYRQMHHDDDDDVEDSPLKDSKLELFGNCSGGQNSLPVTFKGWYLGRLHRNLLTISLVSRMLCHHCMLIITRDLTSFKQCLALRITWFGRFIPDHTEFDDTLADRCPTVDFTASVSSGVGVNRRLSSSSSNNYLYYLHDSTTIL